MNHEQAVSLLDAYVDGELSPVDVLAYEAHAEACETCMPRVAARRAVVARLQSASLRFPMRVSATAPSVERMARASGGGYRRARPAWLGAALAASLVLWSGGYYVGAQRLAATEAAEQFRAAHVRALLVNQSVDVVSSDHHTVKPWFAGRLDFSPPVPELADTGYQLLGGRVDYIEHTRCAALVYRAGNHLVTVFLWPKAGSTASAPRALTSDGYRVVGADTASLHGAIVADMGAEETSRFRNAWLAGAGG